MSETGIRATREWVESRRGGLVGATTRKIAERFQISEKQAREVLYEYTFLRFNETTHLWGYQPTLDATAVDLPAKKPKEKAPEPKPVPPKEERKPETEPQQMLFASPLDFLKEDP